MMATHYNDDRVSLEPSPVKQGDSVHINYQGLLRNSGADQVFLHYGVDGWKNTNTVPMNRMQNGVFGAEIKADAGREVNFCFKDSADNWDNNNGWNWSAEIQ
jgi:hypothetical protein